MKLQQEANRKIIELADKAQTEAIRLSIPCYCYCYHYSYISFGFSFVIILLLHFIIFIWMAWAEAIRPRYKSYTTCC